ncbi:hypothetical protein SAMN05421780_12412 [Flexibacter flexilis DSM 6793]|uniref:Uncharacterized protein n=1 Tax=Flexibacter flexilis DSM 6793 TaxID=927664 RepID=A0A1I1NZ36_9BACT|nr:hypothetical protein [Flexibacter flexilis]SFD02666.1 hypothetical protein SAMN05421780_12412 [Flexibacter flexilis DSM 6793]
MATKLHELYAIKTTAGKTDSFSLTLPQRYENKEKELVFWASNGAANVSLSVNNNQNILIDSLTVKRVDVEAYNATFEGQPEILEVTQPTAMLAANGLGGFKIANKQAFSDFINDKSRRYKALVIKVGSQPAAIAFNGKYIVYDGNITLPSRAEDLAAADAEV